MTICSSSDMSIILLSFGIPRASGARGGAWPEWDLSFGLLSGGKSGKGAIGLLAAAEGAGALGWDDDSGGSDSLGGPDSAAAATRRRFACWGPSLGCVAGGWGRFRVDAALGRFGFPPASPRARSMIASCAVLYRVGIGSSNPGSSPPPGRTADMGSLPARVPAAAAPRLGLGFLAAAELELPPGIPSALSIIASCVAVKRVGIGSSS